MENYEIIFTGNVKIILSTKKAYRIILKHSVCI